MTLIKSISGIRGTIGGAAGDNLTPIDIVRFTTAYSLWLKAHVADKAGASGRRMRVVVGRDARISGPMVEAIVTGTLAGCGMDVINVGLCTTPGVEMAVAARGADGGIIITASHNPRQWNALKLLDGRGEFLDAAAGAEVLKLAASDTVEYPTVDGLGKFLPAEPFDSEHIAAVLALPLVGTEAVRRRKFRIVVDAVNSVGGTVIPTLLRAMGAEVFELNCEPTGEFAHNPEPLPENLTAISAEVVRRKADLGVVIDPDVDRLALVCEDGTMFGEEYTLVAVADYVLSHNPKGNTVSNLSSSRALADVTVAHGGKYYAAAVGEVNVVAKMKEVKAMIGGEGNGGVIYPTLHYGRDALVGVALFLTHLAHKDIKVSELRDSYPKYYISKNKMELALGTDVDALLSAVKNTYKDERVTDIDGVKVDFVEGWVHLRRSNTEPIIRIYSEARDRVSADALAAKVIEQIKGMILA